MWEWLASLFSTEGFPARWYCGSWSERLGWLHIVADSTTFVAYTTIPCVLGGFVLRRRDVPFPRVFWLFAAFIFACGSVHLVEAMIFWQPLYRLSGVLKAMTAVISVATAIALVPTIRKALQLPGFQRATARLAAIVSASRDAVVSRGVDGQIDSWNAAAETLYGWSADEMLGARVDRIVPPDRMDEMLDVVRRVENGESVEPFETERMTKSGRRIPISLSISPVLGPSGEAVGLSAISRDISATRRAEQEYKRMAERLARANRRLRDLADRDPLTGLLNRRGFEAALSGEVERIRRHGTRSSVILIDCDDFKAINERFGHDGGDEVLRVIGERIEDAARDSDQVARIGGDEYMVLASDARVAEAVLVADRIRRAVCDRAIPTPSGQARVSISCGVELVAGEGSSLEEMIGHSSKALQVAKHEGKNQVMVHGGRGAAAAGLPGAGDIRAIAQPIVGVEDGRVRGYELLVRGPAGPLESPDHLFRAHRERDSLARIDLACLERCLDTARDVPADLRVHVNVFPSTLLDVDVEQVANRVLAAGRPRTVCLELNEAMLIGDPAALAPRTAAIRQATRCRLAIDDVGFGRSSLEALILLEPDVIKIDRHFVAGISGDAGARRRLQRLLQVGRALDAEIIAEGVEQEADRRVLQDLGVELAQGYLWGRPASLS